MKNSQMMWAAVAIIFLGFCLPNQVRAEKTDVVVLINGNAVTGEIKSLEFGELRYGTDSMGTVNIEWEEIVALTSDQSLQVEVASGTRYFGNLVAASESGSIAVGRGANIQELDLSHVVRITPIETDDKIWQRLEGSVSFGFNTGKASEVTTGNLNANVRYRARTFLLGMDIASAITAQPGAPTTQNQSLNFNYQRFRNSRWFTDWFAGVESNDAQGVNARFLAGGGLGRYLVQNNKNQFSVLTGLVATQENLTGDTSSTTNAEGKLTVQYLHRSIEPSTDIAFSANIFPLLEDFSSFRADSNLSLRHEFIDDLYIDLSVYYTYVTDPPEGSLKDDYGVITSIGYSF